VPVLSKVQLCGRVVPGIPGSNVCLLRLLCVLGIAFCDGQITRLEKSYGACVSNGVFIIFFFHSATAPSEPRPRHYRGFTITHRHTSQ